MVDQSRQPNTDKHYIISGCSQGRPMVDQSRSKGRPKVDQSRQPNTDKHYIISGCSQGRPMVDTGLTILHARTSTEYSLYH